MDFFSLHFEHVYLLLQSRVNQVKRCRRHEAQTKSPVCTTVYVGRTRFVCTATQSVLPLPSPLRGNFTIFSERNANLIGISDVNTLTTASREVNEIIENINHAITNCIDQDYMISKGWTEEEDRDTDDVSVDGAGDDDDVTRARDIDSELHLL